MFWGGATDGRLVSSRMQRLLERANSDGRIKHHGEVCTEGYGSSGPRKKQKDKSWSNMQSRATIGAAKISSHGALTRVFELLLLEIVAVVVMLKLEVSKPNREQRQQRT